MFIINKSGDTFDYSVTDPSSSPVSGNLREGEGTDIPMSGGPYTLSVGYPSSAQGPYTASDLAASAAVEVVSGSGIQPTSDTLKNCCIYTWSDSQWIQTTSACDTGFECMPTSDVANHHPTGVPGQAIQIPCEPE